VGIWRQQETIFYFLETFKNNPHGKIERQITNSLKAALLLSSEMPRILPKSRLAEVQACVSH
jgi:hypothetical protein